MISTLVDINNIPDEVGFVLDVVVDGRRYGMKPSETDLRWCCRMFQINKIPVEEGGVLDGEVALHLQCFNICGDGDGL